MIKFDIVHIFSSNISDISLPGITFKENGKTNNNKEPKDSMIAYVGESTISLTNNKKIKNSYKLKGDDIYMLTFMTANVKALYNKLKEKKITCTSPSYDTRLNILGVPCKTKFQYMYVTPFKNSNFKICFREIDTSHDLIAYQQSMIPNSASADIMGVKEIKIYGNFNEDNFKTLSEMFDNSYITKDEFSAEIYDNQTLTFIASNEDKIDLLLEVRGKVFKGREINISDDKTESKKITFMY